MILAALSLAVWAGLHFYQRSQHPRGASEQEINGAPLNASINRKIGYDPDGCESENY